MTTSVNVSLASDDKYCKYMATAMLSMLENTKAKINFFIFDAGIRQCVKDKIAGMLKKYNSTIKYVTLDEKTLSLMPPTGSHLTMAIYYRLFAASLIPEADRLIYTDCDTLCLGDIAELYNTDLDGNIMGGVLDGQSSNHANRLGTERYFNSGVLVMDLKAMREQNIEQQFLDYIEKYHGDPRMMDFPDQDVINYVLHNRIAILDPSWNTQTIGIRRSFKAGFDDQATKKNIIHYIVRKPWRYHCRSPFQSLWYKYFAKTPWRIGCIKWPFVKLIKFFFYKRTVSADECRISVLGIDWIKQKFAIEPDGHEYMTTTFLGIKINKKKA